jgi:glycosyltransferase involved in cell wall biosynthesis
MKVIHVVRRFCPNNWGGIEEAVLNLAKAQHKIGIDVMILSTKALNDQAIECIEGIPVRRFNYYYPFLLLSKDNEKSMDMKGGDPFSPDLLSFIKKIDCDIIHCHTMGRIRLSLSNLASKLHKVFFSTIHGGQFNITNGEQQQLFKPGIFNLPFGRITSTLKMYRTQARDNLICLSQDELEKHNADHKAFFIPNGVSQDFLESGTSDVRKIYDIESHKKIILCVSRIDKQKNQIFLIQSMSKLNKDNFQLVLCGPVTDQEYYSSLRDEIKKLGLENSVTFVHDAKTRSDKLLSLYKGSDYFVLPSIHEPFGIVILEAWLAGLPVAANITGGIKDIFNVGKGYGLDINSKVNLGDVLESIDNSFNDKEAFSNIEKAITNYSWRDIAKRHIALYARSKGELAV